MFKPTLSPFWFAFKTVVRHFPNFVLFAEQLLDTQKLERIVFKPPHFLHPYTARNIVFAHVFSMFPWRQTRLRIFPNDVRVKINGQGHMRWAHVKTIVLKLFHRHKNSSGNEPSLLINEIEFNISGEKMKTFFLMFSDSRFNNCFCSIRSRRCCLLGENELYRQFMSAALTWG